MTVDVDVIVEAPITPIVVEVGIQGPKGVDGDPATNYVVSVFGRQGVITPQSGDYTPAQVGADPAGSAAAAEAAAKLYADGVGADTLAYADSVATAAQNYAVNYANATFVFKTDIGVPNGVASLDADGRISQTILGSQVIQNATYRFVTDAEKTAWSSKAEITDIQTQSALDRQYTDGSIAALVGSVPATLDTLAEFAMALGNDANFATTTATAIGYRLRFDTAAQGLTPTQQQNAWTNLGLGTVVAYNAGDFASSAAFNALSSAYTAHAGNTNNPHGVTVAQIGAMPKYGTATTVASASGVVAIDVSATASHYTLTLTENVTSWSFTNLPAAGTYRELHVDIVQHASAAKTVVSPATSGRTAGGAWVASSTLSSRETLGLRIFSTGTVHLFPSGVMG